MVAADPARTPMTHPLRDWLETRLWNGDLYYLGNFNGIDIYKPLRQEWRHEEEPGAVPVQPDHPDPTLV